MKKLKIIHEEIKERFVLMLCRIIKVKKSKKLAKKWRILTKQGEKISAIPTGYSVSLRYCG